MRVLATADIHVANTPAWRLPLFSQLFDDILANALARGCKYVVHAGDLWHEKHGVRVECLSLIYDKLKEARSRGVTWVLLRGNHEIELKSRPHTTLLTLFTQVAMVINRPAILRWPEVQFHFAPWYLHDTFREVMKKLASRARMAEEQCVLFAHVGIDEGQLSPSNYYRVPQRVDLATLRPDVYDLVLLGDYHMRQRFGANALYMGNPIPHNFGDVGIQGLWCLEATGEGLNISDVDLLYTYPEFRTWRFPTEEEDSRWSGHSDHPSPDWPGAVQIKHHRYKIVVPASRLREAKLRYAGLDNVQVEWESDKVKKEAIVSEDRLAGVDQADHEAVFQEVIALKKLDRRFVELARPFLRTAKESLWGKQ